MAIVAPAMLLISSVIAVPHGEAADSHPLTSPSAFCTTIKTFAVSEPLTFITISTYHVWAKLYLASNAKVASEAPTPPVKKLLDEVVTITKYDGEATSLTKLERYVAPNAALWQRAVTQLFKSDIACATNS